jgi:hypothetical protein
MANEDVLAIANEAKELAMRALTEGEKHEAVCAERYKGINERLNQLPDISRAIGNLRGSINKAVGAVIGLSLLSTILGLFVLVTKLQGG